LRRFGTILYQRFADYYGPHYDIQTGFSHQQYGSSTKETQFYQQPPPDTYEKEFNWRYFHGEGEWCGVQYDTQRGTRHLARQKRNLNTFFLFVGFVYVDLPHLRTFDPTYNCTPGIQLMNETFQRRADLKVYTSPNNDLLGSYDIELHPIWNETLGCFTPEVAEEGESLSCGQVPEGNQRAIQMGGDFFYPGTCEADKICEEDVASESEACPEGFVCDEMTTTDSKSYYVCREGYYCDFGTTPDPNLESSRGQVSDFFL